MLFGSSWLATAGATKDNIRADSLVEAFDPVRQSWSIAKVRQVQADQIMLHYIGWCASNANSHPDGY
jgi:hypothetical protein